MAFATVDEYLAKYPACAYTEAVVAAILEDATDAIEGELGPGFDYEAAGEAYAAKLSRVCCSVAHRALPDGGDAQEEVFVPSGATQATQTAGSYSFSASFSGGYGEVYLTKADRVKLGISGGAYLYAEPFGGGDDG